MITQKEVQTLFDYNPLTGIVLRKIYRSHNAQKGAIVGTKSQRYLNVRINKIDYRLHQIIWLLIYGYLPKEIDHENHDGFDNRLDNLKEVTHIQNGRNHKMSKKNTSGFTGICWDKARKKWDASIMIKGKRIGLGRFADKNKAIAARKQANIAFNFHPNHGKTF